MDYYLDAERFLPLKIVHFVEGKFHWRTLYTEIETGGPGERDF